MRQLLLEHASQPSRLVFAPGLLGQPQLLEQQLGDLAKGRLVVISNATVMRHLGDELVHKLPGSPLLCLIEDGEEHKNRRSLEQVYDFLLGNHCSRDTLICALGGGVVGDLAGFAAATYQRGVPLVQIPTTLLAQVDSSVGGKTAINHPLGKNMIGAFYQPRLVLIDSLVLNSLPQRELLAGLAEVVKYALLGDSTFFAWLEDNVQALLTHNPAALEQVIYTSCAHKLKIVREDEYEHGQRALLNLGHSFGHVIESYTHYTSWLHGEAVAVGMRLAARVSQLHGWLDGKACTSIEALLDSFGFARTLPKGLDPRTMVEMLKLDKKNRADQLRLVLLKGIGKAEVCDELSPSTLMPVLEQLWPALQDE